MLQKNRLILTLCALLFVFCLTTSAAPETPQTSMAAPDWQLKNLEGKPVKLSDFKGKVVLLNFWATWCPPCREEIPDLVSLQRQYAARGLVVLGISMDEGGPARVASFAKRFEITYPIVMGDEKTSAAYGGIQVLPTTFIIDRKGNVVDGLQGATDRAGFEEKIKPIL
ncbi:MAG: TlpA disulfide reductase family protein [Chthoniobacterales bacterium]